MLFVVDAGAQCPGPAQRTAIINLQRSLEAEGTRAGQIPLTDTCGNQRYAQYVEVNPDTINYIPADSGNTQNLSEFVRDTTGTLWYIDWQGNAVSFQGGGGSCDVDFLQISDNSCPDALTDSIYKYRYVAVGARYVWPGAELLVNDSSSTGIAVIQGSRNARLALYDSFNGTFTMFDHGGTNPVIYVPADANLLFKTTGGTPETPVGSQVNHFAINAQDSTIQAYQYPNTRTDTNSVLNFLYTDGVGKLRSKPINYFIDTLEFGANIYNIDGTFPAGQRLAQFSEQTELLFNYPSGYPCMYIYAGEDNSGTNGSIIFNSPIFNNYIQIDDNYIRLKSFEVQIGDVLNTDLGQGILVESGKVSLGGIYLDEPETYIELNNSSQDIYIVTPQNIKMGDVESNINGIGYEQTISEINIGDIFSDQEKGIIINIADQGEIVIKIDGASFVLDNQEINATYGPAGLFNVESSAPELCAIYQDTGNLVITGQDLINNGYYILASVYDNPSASMSVRSDEADIIAGMYLHTGATKSAEVTISAYDASATTTLNAVQIDTNGVQINTQGATGSAGSILQSDGAYTMWTDPGVFNADALSYSPGGGGNMWTPVTANRSNVFATTGTIFPSESITHILIDTSGTTSTINLNYTPDSRYDGDFTTERWITNWGSGNSTVQTNQSWRFKTVTGYANTLTIAPGETYKLLWISDPTPANCRFYAIRIQ